MTDPVERRVRELADEYMAAHPGVPRQEAKRRVRMRVRWQVIRESAAVVARNFSRTLSNTYGHHGPPSTMGPTRKRRR